ncbi:hypothetical protein RN001_006533 [Aquatica leii]|uniref:Transcription initiation factor TFIID subunit 6 n=1 Tax=Aquatica leii TaxID=1421715 RepID=A0AAN7SJW1_9COLE|nr:hypothetical protein RN001_006533 [Aquatica leii]
MKPSSSKVGNSSKSKKNSKDREKRKSQTAQEPTIQQNSEKGSPNKDNFRKFSGYGIEELTIITEQSVNEHLTEEVCVAFIEDINYKLRHIIYEAIVKARLSSRNHITSSDIDDTFESLQIEKIYGAEKDPVWVPLGDQNLYYLDDQKINLINLAEEPVAYLQPEEPIITRKWLPETKEVGGHLKQYFTIMCEAIVDKDEKIYQVALGDIKKNTSIGPIIEWFYHFGYFLLSKDITYDSLTLRALKLIKALEFNPVSSFIISDKQIMLLTRLLLQRLLRFFSNSELIKPICQILALLCKRIPVRVMILKKMIAKFPEVRDVFPLPIICAVNYLGVDAFGAILIPHLKSLLVIMETQREPDFILEMLRSYNIICIERQNTNKFCDRFYDVFGEAIIPYWKYPRVVSDQETDSSRPDYWLYTKGQLLRSRRKIPPKEKRKLKKIHIEEAFPEQEDDIIKVEKVDYDYENKAEEISVKPSITFLFHSCAPAVGRLRFLKLSSPVLLQNVETQVTIGKRSLLSPILKTFKTPSTCKSHTLMYHNL